MGPRDKPGMTARLFDPPLVAHVRTGALHQRDPLAALRLAGERIGLQPLVEELALQLLPALEPRRIEPAAGQRRPDRAARLPLVAAVAEPAFGGERIHVG